jgi:hypothetical protein
MFYLIKGGSAFLFADITHTYNTPSDCFHIH